MCSSSPRQCRWMYCCMSVSSFKFFPVAGSCHFSCDHVSSAHIAFRRTELAKRFRGWGRGQLGHSVRIRSYFPDTLDLFLDCRKSPVHPRHRYSYKYERTILDCQPSCSHNIEICAHYAYFSGSISFLPWIIPLNRFLLVTEMTNKQVPIAMSNFAVRDSQHMN